MKKTIIPAVVICLMGMTSCNNTTPETVALSNQNDTLSWAMGTSMGTAIKESGLTFNEDVLMAAVRSAMEGNGSKLDQESYEKALASINLQIAQNQQQQDEKMRAEVEAKEKAYFEKLLKENPNVKQTEHGFYYEVLKPGKGPNAKYAQRIKFDYKGFFMFTGKMIDQTYGNRQPIVTAVTKHMFPGLVQALQMMNAGSIYRFYFPQHTAFGKFGDKNIPPYTPIVYEVEVHELYNN